MVLTRQQQQWHQNLADSLNIPYTIVGEELTVPIERLEGLLGQRERREDFVIEVVGNLCKKLGNFGRGSDEKLGRAEVNRRRNGFTRTGELESQREDMLIDQLKTESAKLKDTNRSLLGQYHAEKRRQDQNKSGLKKNEAKLVKAKIDQIASLETKKAALKKTKTGHEATIQRLKTESKEKNINISTLQTSLAGTTKQVNILKQENAQYRKSISNPSKEISKLQRSVTAKEQETTKVKGDFDTLLTKAAEFDSDQQRQIKELKAEIKRIEAYRPTIESTCRLIQMAYREFKIGKQTLEQEVLKQQKEIELLLPEEETTAHLSNKLREQYASSCLLEWKVQEQETEMKEMRSTLEEQGSELEAKDQQVKVLYEKLTERMHKLKSGHVLEKGRRYSF